MFFRVRPGYVLRMFKPCWFPFCGRKPRFMVAKLVHQDMFGLRPGNQSYINNMKHIFEIYVCDMKDTFVI